MFSNEQIERLEELKQELYKQEEKEKIEAANKKALLEVFDLEREG